VAKKVDYQGQEIVNYVNEFRSRKIMKWHHKHSIMTGEWKCF